MNLNPTIFIGNIRVDEPITTITDVFVAVVCFYAFFKLVKIPLKNKVHLFLRYYFFSMGIATFSGGVIGHGFLYLFSFEWKLIGWLTSMFSIALVERAAIEYSRPLISNKLGVLFKWINIVELLTFVVITLVTLNFFYVEVHTAYGLLFVVSSLNIYVFYRTRSKASKLFLIAVAFSSVGALFYMNEWALDQWFNHYDISHIFLTISAWVFYLASKAVLKDPLLNNADDSPNNSD